MSPRVNCVLLHQGLKGVHSGCGEKKKDKDRLGTHTRERGEIDDETGGERNGERGNSVEKKKGTQIVYLKKIEVDGGSGRNAK